MSRWPTIAILGCMRILLGASILLAVGVAPGDAHGPRHNPVRHQFVMQNGLPEAYRDARNPLGKTRDNLKGGAVLYDEHCALCHGRAGQGNGEGAADLVPPPPSLAGLYDGPMGGMAGGRGMMAGRNMDAFTFWAVSEGGAALGTGMPAYKEVLSKDQRWQILLYMANGFSIDTGK